MHSVVLKNKLEIVTANQRPGQLFWILNHFVKVQHFSRTPRGTLVVSKYGSSGLISRNIFNISRTTACYVTKLTINFLQGALKKYFWSNLKSRWSPWLTNTFSSSQLLHLHGDWANCCSEGYGKILSEKLTLTSGLDKSNLIDLL
jgi:hypothetical protein